MLHLSEKKKIICEVREILTFADTPARLTGLNYEDGGRGLDRNIVVLQPKLELATEDESDAACWSIQINSIHVTS